MDNKLLENCIRLTLEAANEQGEDIMRMAHDLTAFHELIHDSDSMFNGYKIYATVSRLYYSRLRELGLIADDEDEDDGV